MIQINPFSTPHVCASSVDGNIQLSLIARVSTPDFDSDESTSFVCSTRGKDYASTIMSMANGSGLSPYASIAPVLSSSMSADLWSAIPVG